MYKIVKSETTQIGRFNVILDSIEKNGETYPYSYIEFKNGVCALCFVDSKHLLLLKEYRHAIRQWVYGFPSGMIEDGEDYRHTVKREIQEETGYQVEELCDLGCCYPSYGSTTEKIYLYTAKVKPFTTPSKDALELAEVEIVSLSEMEEMINDGRFVQGAGLAAWLKWKMQNK